MTCCERNFDKRNACQDHASVHNKIPLCPIYLGLSTLPTTPRKTHHNLVMFTKEDTRGEALQIFMNLPWDATPAPISWEDCRCRGPPQAQTTNRQCRQRSCPTFLIQVLPLPPGVHPRSSGSAREEARSTPWQRCSQLKAYRYRREEGSQEGGKHERGQREMSPWNGDKG